MSESINTIGEVEPSTSIIFLGSGFSLGAKNIAGGRPPNGNGLRRHFIQKLKFPADTSYDLQVLTEEFASDDSQRLRDEVYQIFRIASLDNAQAAILDEPWRRIYTTNYDDAVEVYRLGKKLPPNGYDVSEPVPNKLPHGAVVHLHGSIRLVTPENVRTSLVLGEASYVNQYVVRSPWYDQFQRDLVFASALYIIGYSLADYHIAALLLEDSGLATRTLFIQGPDQDDVFLRRTAPYGRTLFIGTNGFADALKKAPRAEAPTDLSRLKSFRPLNPVRDRSSIVQPTAGEVYDLLVYGNFDPGRLARSQPGETYAIARAEAVRSAADAIEHRRALVVDGRLGNGKTLFLHLLAFELSKRGWTCLLFRPGHPEIAGEVVALRSVERLVIFVEQYSTSQDALQGLRAALPDVKFVIEVRTGTFEVRYHEFAELLPKPFERISLNQLTNPEMAAFTRLCKYAGLPLPATGGKQPSDLRDMLLELFNNRSIRDRIEKSLAPLFETRITRRILVMTMLIAAYQGSISAGFIRSVIGADPFVALKPVEDLAKEIFELSADSFRARSAVFSAFVIKAFIEPEEIADAVTEVTLAAAERKPQRAYRVLMSNMMAYSSLHRMLRDKTDAMAVILRIYERLRYDERVNDEPLFWLQYAIAMAELPKLDAAREYIQTAYRKANELPGFQTFQIDTQAFRIALLFATQERPGGTITNIEEVLAGLERIDGMLTEDSHRAYAVKVLEGIPLFVSARLKDMSASEATAVQFWLLKIARSLSALPADFKATTGSELVRTHVTESAARFLQADQGWL
ncbi:SIR2 family protein [Methylocapsa aurea]|uniref:SIR2 family protein n=1 Tax=Methylocapsa aurea TaxID=663610 RepID=UPI0005674E7A|nr:SIR2 family protein [Methylocapsa aurea]